MQAETGTSAQDELVAETTGAAGQQPSITDEQLTITDEQLTSQRPRVQPRSKARWLQKRTGGSGSTSWLIDQWATGNASATAIQSIAHVAVLDGHQHGSGSAPSTSNP